MDNRLVGVFDSGVGGVSVLRTLVDVLPQEHYLYYGDTLNMPYGDRSEQEILALVQVVAERLVQKGVKALVIACNTATSAAAQTLREELPIPVVGMEPALKPAAIGHKSGKILVMATSATLRQSKFRHLMVRYGQDALILPCPGLMEFVERGDLDSPELDAYLAARFESVAHETIDAVVLGCTHYVFLKRAIARRLPGATLYDGNRGTANRLKTLLEGAHARAEGPGSVTFEASDRSAIERMQSLFMLPNEKIK